MDDPLPEAGAELPQEGQVARGDGVVGALAGELLDRRVERLAREDGAAEERGAQRGHLVAALEPVGGVVLLGERFEEPAPAAAGQEPEEDGALRRCGLGLEFRALLGGGILVARGRLRHALGGAGEPEVALGRVHPFEEHVALPFAQGLREPSLFEGRREAGTERFELSQGEQQAGRPCARERRLLDGREGGHPRGEHLQRLLRQPSPRRLHAVEHLLRLSRQLGQDDGRLVAALEGDGVGRLVELDGGQRRQQHGAEVLALGGEEEEVLVEQGRGGLGACRSGRAAEIAGRLARARQAQCVGPEERPGALELVEERGSVLAELGEL